HTLQNVSQNATSLRLFPGLSVIRNPLKAQRLAEKINNKREAVCTKHLLLS
ncbi:DUF1317 family protein, partial [Escherichia coli]